MDLKKDKIRKDILILELMSSRIKKYRENSIYVNDLIYGLESFLKQLEIINRKWKQEFFSKWETLEITYSLSLDEERQEPYDEEKDEKIILSTLDELEKMVLEKRQELKKIVVDQDEDFS